MLFRSSLNYKILDWLSVSGRVRLDNSFNDYTEKYYAGTNTQMTEASTRGLYTISKTTDKQLYADFTAPNIYDQKVKASMGTVHNSRGVPGMLEYFNINLYSSTLLYDRLLSPLAKNGRKYYKYLIDSIMGGTDNRQYKIRFIPRSKSDQLVGGYIDRKSTRLNSSHIQKSRMPSSA